jgi:hypothetical protein
MWVENGRSVEGQSPAPAATTRLMHAEPMQENQLDEGFRWMVHRAAERRNS